MSYAGRLIRLYWCSAKGHEHGSEAVEFVQREGDRTGHYHVAPLAEALAWYGYTAKIERVEVQRITVDA